MTWIRNTITFLFSSSDVTDDSMQSSKLPACSPAESSSSQQVVQVILATLIHTALEQADLPPRRQRKKKKDRGEPRYASDSDQWERLKDCGVAGWKRILARNCDTDGGWGFNFVRQAFPPIMFL